MARQRILVVTNGALCRNPRALKEATTLGQHGYDVTVLTVRNHAPSESQDAAILARSPFRREFIDVLGDAGIRFRTRVSRWLNSRAQRYLRWESPRALGPVHALLRRARSLSADLTIVHNEGPHWVGVVLASEGRRVAADIEDWHSEDLLPDARRMRPLRLLRTVERALLNQLLYTSTPSAALASKLHDTYGGARPFVVTNSFPLETQSVSAQDDAVPSFFWFSQTLGPGRGVEPFLQAWSQTKEPSRVVLLGDRSRAYESLLLSNVPASLHERISFRELVPPHDLPRVIAEHQIGLALEDPAIRSRDLTITNKILQYLNAGLAIVASDTAGQREVFAHDPQIGIMISSCDAATYAKQLDELLADRSALARRQQAARRLAERRFSWEHEEPHLLKLVTQALASQGNVHHT